MAALRPVTGAGAPPAPAPPPTTPDADTIASPDPNASPDPSAARLVIYNIQKKNNVRTLFTMAYCYDLDVCLVKQPRFAEETHVDERVRPYLRLRQGDEEEDSEEDSEEEVLESFGYERFDRLEACVSALKGEGFEVWGIEIDESAVDVEHAAWSEKLALMPGNEGHGLSEAQKKLCDRFVIINQFGNGTASLNVAVATSIVCQRYAAWRERNC